MSPGERHQINMRYLRSALEHLAPSGAPLTVRGEARAAWDALGANGTEGPILKAAQAAACLRARETARTVMERSGPRARLDACLTAAQAAHVSAMEICNYYDAGRIHAVIAILIMMEKGQ